VGIFDRFKFGSKSENVVKQSTTSTPLTSVQSGYHFQHGDSSVSDLIYGVIQKLVNTVSMADLEFYKDGKKTSNKMTCKLKYNINPYQTFLEFMRFMETQRCLTGNAFAYIHRDYVGSVLGIYPLNSNDVSTYRLSDGSLYYKLNIKTQGIPDLIDPLDMIHVKNVDLLTIYTNSKGSNPITTLNNTQKLDSVVQESAVNKLDAEFANFMITDKNSVNTQATKDAVTEKIKEYYEAYGGSFYNDFGVEIERLESLFNFNDLKVTDEFVKSRLAYIYNVPSTIIGAAYDYNGIEETNRFFIQSTIAPILKQYDDQFSKKLLDDYDRESGSFFTFDSLSLIKYDLKTLTDHYTKLFRSSIMSSDEVREKFHLEPRGGVANELWISGDMYLQSTPISERNNKGIIQQQSEPKVPDIEGGD